jgi:hypothetical protein
MLEGHAPAFFEAEGVAPRLEAAVRALAAVPADFPAGLPPAEGMARLDALYVSSVHGVPRPFSTAGACAYAAWLARDAPAIWAWLFVEILALLGVDRPLRVPPRAMRDERTADLYWLTHLVLLETHYLRAPPVPGRLDAAIEELLLATPEVLAGRQIDLAAEIALCLQATGEAQTAEHRALLDLLSAHQDAAGRVVDPSSEGTSGDPEEEARLAAHATGAALLALAYAR